MLTAVSALKHLSVLLALYFITVHQAWAESAVIRADKNDFPATYTQQNRWDGMDIVILKEIFSRAGLSYDIKDIPFPRSLLQAKEGSVHVIPNLVKNDERSEYLRWLGPTRITCIGLVVQNKDQNIQINTTDELLSIALKKNKKIGYLSGASYSSYFDARMKTDNKLINTLHFLPDNSQHREMLQLGRLFGYFYDAFEMKRRLEDPIYSKIYHGLALHDYRIEGSCTGAYIGVSKKFQDQAWQQLIKAFDSMRKDGSFNNIHLQWVGTPAPSSVSHAAP